jgi:hypothetical protein
MQAKIEDRPYEAHWKQRLHAAKDPNSCGKRNAHRLLYCIFIKITKIKLKKWICCAIIALATKISVFAKMAVRALQKNLYKTKV